MKIQVQNSTHFPRREWVVIGTEKPIEPRLGWALPYSHLQPVELEVPANFTGEVEPIAQDLMEPFAIPQEVLEQAPNLRPALRFGERDAWVRFVLKRTVHQDARMVRSLWIAVGPGFVARLYTDLFHRSPFLKCSMAVYSETLDHSPDHKPEIWFTSGDGNFFTKVYSRDEGCVSVDAGRRWKLLDGSTWDDASGKRWNFVIMMGMRSATATEASTAGALNERPLNVATAWGRWGAWGKRPVPAAPEVKNSWGDPWGYRGVVLLPNAATSGRQAEFGTWGSLQQATGDPTDVDAYRNALFQDGCRVTHFFDAEGEIIALSTLDDYGSWSERPQTRVYGNRLGRTHDFPWPRNQWLGRDDEHNQLFAVPEDYILHGDPISADECYQSAEHMTSALNRMDGGSGPYIARALGRVALSAVMIYRATGISKPLHALVQRVKWKEHPHWLDQRQAYGAPVYQVQHFDLNYLPHAVAWSPWHDGLMVWGLDAARRHAEHLGLDAHELGEMVDRCGRYICAHGYWPDGHQIAHAIDVEKLRTVAPDDYGPPSNRSDPRHMSIRPAWDSALAQWCRPVAELMSEERILQAVPQLPEYAGVQPV